MTGAGMTASPSAAPGDAEARMTGEHDQRDQPEGGLAPLPVEGRAFRRDKPDVQGEQRPATTNLQYRRDHLGSIRETTDATGAMQTRLDFDLWGRRTVIAGAARPESVIAIGNLFWCGAQARCGFPGVRSRRRMI